MHCRLFSAFASETAEAQPDDEAWQAGFKLSYDVGCSVLRGRQTLPALGIDTATGASHLMQLALQHQELVAAPAPVAGQGTHLPSVLTVLLNPFAVVCACCCHYIKLVGLSTCSSSATWNKGRPQLCHSLSMHVHYMSWLLLPAILEWCSSAASCGMCKWFVVPTLPLLKASEHPTDDMSMRVCRGCSGYPAGLCGGGCPATGACLGT